ncbi:MAG: hypothetical protein MUF81_03260 [Verrucomicrobia bacterium]|nr:hypothetical protein [Verrucomicrobiota bacterium]
MILHQTMPAAGTNSTTDVKPETKSGEVPRRKLGRTGEMVSTIGVGGHSVSVTPIFFWSTRG